MNVLLLPTETPLGERKLALQKVSVWLRLPPRSPLILGFYPCKQSSYFTFLLPSLPPFLPPSPGSQIAGADLHERTFADLGVYPTHDRPLFQGRHESQGEAKGRKRGTDAAEKGGVSAWVCLFESAQLHILIFLSIYSCLQNCIYQDAVFTKLLEQEVEFFDKAGPGEITSYLSQDISGLKGKKSEGEEYTNFLCKQNHIRARAPKLT